MSDINVLILHIFLDFLVRTTTVYDLNEIKGGMTMTPVAQNSVDFTPRTCFAPHPRRPANPDTRNASTIDHDKEERKT